MQPFQILFFYKKYCFVNKLFLYLPSSNREIIGDSEFQSFAEQSQPVSSPKKFVEVGISFANQESGLVEILGVLPERRCQR